MACSLVACVDDDTKDDVSGNVDQSKFLRNSAKIISQSYAAGNLSAKELSIAAEELKNKSVTGTLTISELDKLSNKLKKSWQDWQKISPFGFGAANQFDLKASVNIYKTDTATIENNISTGNFNLDLLAMKDAKGFPALDYLLNGESQTILLEKLKKDSNRIDYIVKVANDISIRIKTVTDDWNSNQQSFEGNTGTDVGSSTGMLVNALNQHYERFFRDNKIGIPLGVRSSGIPRPDFCEAVYGEYSIELAIENFIAMKNLYLGNDSSNTSGYGLDDYLIASDASDLNEVIVAQLNIIELKLESLSDPFPLQIASQPNLVQETYAEIQKLIVLWKVDMPSRMGVLITYQDNDGD